MYYKLCTMYKQDNNMPYAVSVEHFFYTSVESNTHVKMITD